MDNEWQWKLLPTRSHTSNSRVNTPGSSLRVLGKNRKRIRFASIVSNVAYFAGRVPWYHRCIERAKRSKEEWKLAMHMMIHMLTIMIASSYITLSILATPKASSLWAPYTSMILALAVVNILLERDRNG